MPADTESGGWENVGKAVGSPVDLRSIGQRLVCAAAAALDVLVTLEMRRSEASTVVKEALARGGYYAPLTYTMCTPVPDYLSAVGWVWLRRGGVGRGGDAIPTPGAPLTPMGVHWPHPIPPVVHAPHVSLAASMAEAAIISLDSDTVGGVPYPGANIITHIIIHPWRPRLGRWV